MILFDKNSCYIVKVIVLLGQNLNALIQVAPRYTLLTLLTLFSLFTVDTVELTLFALFTLLAWITLLIRLRLVYPFP